MTLADSDRLLVVDLPNEVTDIAQISVGAKHVCLRTTAGVNSNEAGDLYCWGSNAYGQLGAGLDSVQKEPVEVSFP